MTSVLLRRGEDTYGDHVRTVQRLQGSSHKPRMPGAGEAAGPFPRAPRGAQPCPLLGLGLGPQDWERIKF